MSSWSSSSSSSEGEKEEDRRWRCTPSWPIGRSRRSLSEGSPPPPRVLGEGVDERAEYGGENGEAGENEEEEEEEGDEEEEAAGEAEGDPDADADVGEAEAYV